MLLRNRFETCPARTFILLALLCSAATPALAAAESDDGQQREGQQGDIVVTGRAAASRARQEDAPNIIQTISQEEARGLPNLNAGEAIARLPGAALSVDTGQGRWVNIRGLDSDLTSTTYGGVHLPPTNPVTPQNGGRAFAFDAFPTGLIGSLTITKTNRPDMDAEALGGTIEITPKALAPGEDHFIEARLGSGEQFSRHTAIVDVSASAGIRFGGKDGSGPFSIVGSFSYYKDALGTDDRRGTFIDKPGVPDLALSNFTQAFYRFHRTTKGGAIEAAYEPDADTRLYARYVRSGYDEQVDRDRFTIKTTGTSLQNPDGSITSPVKQFDKTLRDMLEQVSLDVVEVGGRNKIGAMKLEYHASYAQGRDYRPYDTIPTFSTTPSGATFTYNQANASFPTYTVGGANPYDPTLYTLKNVTNNTQLYRTREWSGGIDATAPTHLIGGFGEQIKAGLAFRARTNTHAFHPYTSTAVPTVNLAAAAPGANILYYASHYANGPNISLDYIRHLFAGGTGTGFATNDAANLFAGGAVQQDNKEDVYAGYVQGETSFGDLHLLAGLRIEHTEARYSGNTSVPTGVAGSTPERGGQTVTLNGSTLIPVSSTASYTNFFPTIQARYALRENLVLRAAYSTAIARPGFNQIDPAATIDAANNVVTAGNPNLKPITSNSFDLSIERYLPYGGIVSIGLFDKEMSNYIFGRTVLGSITDPVIASALGPQSTPTQLVTYSNIPHATARGFEVNYDQHLSFLPGPFANFGVSGNYTFVDSSAEIRPGESAGLPSTSRHNYNAALYWDDGRLNLRAAVSYVGRSLLFVGSRRALDQYTEHRFSLDVGGSYAVTRNASIYFAGRNLLNTAHTLTEGAPNRVIQREMFGASILGGVNFKF